MKKHTIPVHLETDDKLLYGLTARQVMVLALGLTLSYSAWTSVTSLGPVIAFLFSIVPSVLAFLDAFLQLGKKPLDEWFLIWLFFMASPRVYLWEALPTDQEHLAENHDETFCDYGEEHEQTATPYEEDE